MSYVDLSGVGYLLYLTYHQVVQTEAKLSKTRVYNYRVRDYVPPGLHYLVTADCVIPRYRERNLKYLEKLTRIVCHWTGVTPLNRENERIPCHLARRTERWKCLLHHMKIEVLSGDSPVISKLACMLECDDLRDAFQHTHLSTEKNNIKIRRP